MAQSDPRLARRVVIEPRAGWIEPTNLFAAVLLGPGNRKSTVFADTTRPLKQIGTEMVEIATPEVAKLKIRRRQSELRLPPLSESRELSQTTDFPVNGGVSVPGPVSPLPNHESNGHPRDAFDWKF